MIDEVEGGWDDPEVMGRLDGLDEMDSGDTWTWVPPWSRQNAYGADRRLWGDGRPPVTQRLAESLGSYELAHFRGEVSWDYLRYRADRVMLRRSVEGFTAEDVVADVLIDMESIAAREGCLPGDRDWSRIAEVVIKRRVGQLLRKQGGQKGRGNRYNVREAHFYGEFIALRGSQRYEHADPEDEPSDHDPLSNVESEGHRSSLFSSDFVERLSAVLTPRELEAVVYTYQDDLTNAQTAERMGCSEKTVTVLLSTARNRISKGFTPLFTMA